MIDLINVSVVFGERKILDSISYKFLDKGMYFIVGDSGSGKTTLLNVIAGLISYDGCVLINNEQIDQHNEKQKDNLRLNKIGFVFQDYKLFNKDTVKSNISLPLLVAKNITKNEENAKINDLLNIVDLKDKKNKKVSLLSGGEKQRVCIARAMVNDPSIILADEPTGALDENNGYKIIEILRNISKTTLVIVVSHDLLLANKYADTILKIKDGQIIEENHLNNSSENKSNIIFKTRKNRRTHTIPFLFLFRHTIASFVNRKWRTLITNLMTSFALIGIGLSISLTSSISTSIKSMYSDLVSEDKIVISTRNNYNSVSYLEGAPYEDALEIKYNYPDYIQDVGVIYHSNLNNQFIDENSFTLISEGRKVDLPMLKANHLNDYVWLDNDNSECYPSKPASLGNDEIVLGINLGMVQSICYGLSIARSISSLSSYLSMHEVNVVFSAKNNSWSYSDSEMFRVRAVILSFNPCIYHYNHLFNEHIFETLMRFPSTLLVEGESKYPWTLKKTYYFKFIDYRDEFLLLTKQNDDFDDYEFEISSSNLFVNTIAKDSEIKDINNVLFLTNTSTKMNYKLVNSIMRNHTYLSSPIYGTSGGYSIYSSGLVSGFSDMTFFSFSEEYLEEKLGVFSKLDNNEYTSISNDEKLLIGYFVKGGDGVCFNPINNQEIIGEIPQNYDEIVISSGFATKCNYAYDGSSLYIATCKKMYSLGENKYIRDFIVVPIKVVGIIENDEPIIYHDSSWTTEFFKDRFGISSFSLAIDSVMLTVNDCESNYIDELKKDYPSLKITNPIQDVNLSIESVCQKMEIGLLIFSGLSSLIAIILLIFTSYLNALDSKKDLALSRCLGISKKEANKFLYMNDILSCLLSFVISSIEIVIVSFLIDKYLDITLSKTKGFTFDFRSIGAMFLLSFIICLISSLLISHKFSKKDPLSLLRTKNN